MRRLVIIGDSPDRQSGLGRICGDLIGVFATSGKFDEIRTVLLGDQSIHNRMEDFSHWGHGDLLKYAACTPASDPLYVFTVYDAARCVDIAQAVKDMRAAGREVYLWGYFAVDAEGPLEGGAFGGPAADALQEYTRILAYTEFGARVLKATAPHHDIHNLPHGLAPEWFETKWRAGWTPVINPPVREFITEMKKKGVPIIGAVGANQPRKDWGWFFGGLRELKALGQEFAVWVHTDRLATGAWAFPELFNWLGEGGNYLLTGANATDDLLEGGGGLTDASLAWLYDQCAVTVAPGLGEGWGYPIAESLARGVPVIGVSYAGGPEVGDMDEVRWDDSRVEGAYLLKRPVMDPEELGKYLKNIIGQETEESKAELIRSVSRLAWPTLTPAWHTWISQGL